MNHFYVNMGHWWSMVSGYVTLDKCHFSMTLNDANTGHWLCATRYVLPFNEPLKCIPCWV